MENPVDRMYRIFQDEQQILFTSCKSCLYVPWNFKRDQKSTRRIITELKARFVAVKPNQPRLCVGQTYTFTVAHVENSIDIHAGAVIFHLDANDAVSRRGADLNPS